MTRETPVEEIFAYLREVLGIKYVPLTYAAVIDSPEGLEAVEEAVQVAAQTPSEIEIDDNAAIGETINAPDPDRFPQPNSDILTVENPASLAALEKAIEGCRKCKLSKSRKNVVFGEGSPGAELMFIGEGPGEQEDASGRPFVGPAGDLLTKMIGAMGLKRDDVYIANVVKCRPPMNRNPEPDEIHECAPVLLSQIKLINPKVIVALGTFAAQTLLKSTDRIGQLRGRVHRAQGRKIVPTYHPAYLLRNPSEKRAVWEDLKLAIKELRSADQA